MNDDGEWVEEGHPSLRPIKRSPGGSRLNGVGWFFIILAVLALLVGGTATLGLGLETGAERKFFGLLLGGGMLAVVALFAAILRVLGVPFYRDD
jgi:hypothetical protein